MTTVGDILSRKPGKTHWTWPFATVLEATKQMNDCRIGSLLVLDDAQSVVGILTERDLLTRVIAAEKDPRTTKVAEVMTRDVLYCTPDTQMEELRTIMKERRIRHVPVRNENHKLMGLISMGDLNAFESESLNFTLSALHDYIARG